LVEREAWGGLLVLGFLYFLYFGEVPFAVIFWAVIGVICLLVWHSLPVFCLAGGGE